MNNTKHSSNDIVQSAKQFLERLYTKEQKRSPQKLRKIFFNAILWPLWSWSICRKSYQIDWLTKNNTFLNRKFLEILILIITAGKNKCQYSKEGSSLEKRKTPFDRFTAICESNSYI